MRKFFSLHRNVRTRIGLSFISKLIDAMILTYIAIYLSAHIGVAAAGALILVFAIFAVVGMLFGGHISEHWGRRPVLILGDATGFVCLTTMAFAYYDNWGALAVYFSYAIAKFGSNMALPANDATIIDVAPPTERRYVYTVNYWVTNLALGGGALVGGFLYLEHFGSVIVGGAIGTGCALVITTVFVSETKPLTAVGGLGKATGLRRFVDGYRVVLLDSTFRRLIIAATLALTLEGQMNGYLGIRFAGDLPVQHVLPFLSLTGVQLLGMLKAENTLLVVVLALFINVVLRRLSDRIRLYGGIALFAGGYVVLALAGTAWVLLVAGLVLTVGELANVPVKQALLADLAPEQGRSRYMAAYYLNIRFGQVLNAILISSSAVLGAIGMAGVYALFGVVIILQYRTILARRATPARTVTPVAG